MACCQQLFRVACQRNRCSTADMRRWFEGGEAAARRVLEKQLEKDDR
jgi:hypothetical protein